MGQRAVVLLNPLARGGANPPVRQILSGFQEGGWEVEVWAGTGARWTETAARRAVALGADAVFGAGGDGVLASILPAILETRVALGVVPLGTGNVWARELGLSLNVKRAIQTQLANSPRSVDVGRANGRPFLVIASAGFDASIVEFVEAQSKMLGQIAYPLAGMSLVSAVRGVPSRVWLDDEPPLELALLAGIATNGRLYGGLVRLVPGARLDDGFLDIALFAGSGPVEVAVHAARVLAGLHVTDSNVILRQVRRVRIETLGGTLPVQTDGDPRGTTPLDLEVNPGALLALGVPAPVAR